MGAWLVAGTLLMVACGPGGTEGVTVDMLDNRFDPAEFTVEVGTPVTFLGVGRNPHNAVAADGSWSTEDEFGSLNMLEGDSATLTFQDPGTYQFFCTFHGNADGDGMAGTLTVVPAEDSS